MSITPRQLFFSFILLFATTMAIAQRPAGSDTTNRPAGPGTGRPSTGPKPYREVITDKARTDEGLFKVHRVDDSNDETRIIPQRIKKIKAK